MPGLALILMLLLVACVPSIPAATVVERPTVTPTEEPSPPSTPTSEPSIGPTETPGPTPADDPAAMTLEATSCNGGVVLQWSPSRHPDFHHYIGLRSPEREIAPGYPPIAPAVDWGDLYASDPFVTSGFDATVVPSSTIWHYRVMAYDADGGLVSRSSVASGRIHRHDELGPLEADVLPDGAVRVSWSSFDGLPGCFSSYRVLFGTAGVANTVLTSVSDRSRVELETDALHAGTTYTLQVQAVRTTTLGHFVVGESDPLVVGLPEP